VGGFNDGFVINVLRLVRGGYSRAPGDGWFNSPSRLLKVRPASLTGENIGIPIKHRTIMKTPRLLLAAGLAGMAVTALRSSADPLIASWQTNYAGQYARIYTNAAMQTAGASLTTWSNGSQVQSLPAYAGIQEIYSSTNWVYVRSTGLASYTMGPWQAGFPNLPANQKFMFRIPRSPVVPASKAANGGGAIGCFVDGVAMFNSWDAFTWNGSTDASGGNGYWNRDAYINEGATFDPALAHQQNTGTYHYHANPIALRYQLGDHVDYNTATKTYSESSVPVTRHSPILGWVADGYPIYGPYGYANATNASSGLRRMVSGYVPRNGAFGTSNLTANGRSTIPAWATRLDNVSATQSGPAVSTSYPLGRYMEDNDYLGDHGYVQGVDFDLDEYNGRFCVTPEYPNGTYAYFVAISASGAPVFPYNIGRGYYGSATGGTVSSITQVVTTNFLGNTNLIQKLNVPVVKNGAVTLTWSAVEGGSYQVEASTNLANWNVLATGLAPNQIAAGYTNISNVGRGFYRVGRTSVAAFDSSGTTSINGGGGGSSVVAPGGSASRGTTVTVSITLPANPPAPPANAPITSVVLGGSISGSNISDAVSGTVLATFIIPAGAATGLQNIVATFGSTGPTITITGALTIN
jgi:hypothetical protein